MPFAPLKKLLDNTNGRQRRFVLLGLLGTCLLTATLVILLTSTALSFGNGDSSTVVTTSNRPISGSPNTGINQLTVAVHDPLYERFDTPGTPVSLNLAIAREFASRNNLQISIVQTDSREDALRRLRARSVDLVFSNHIEPSIYPMPGLKSVTLDEVQLLLIGLKRIIVIIQVIVK